MDNCKQCGNYTLTRYDGSPCHDCEEKARKAEEAKLCHCGDCDRKRGAEDFENPGAYALLENARRVRESVTRCVECGTAIMTDPLSLACSECVKKLGSDAETGRWDNRPEPSEDAKKGAA